MKQKIKDKLKKLQILFFILFIQDISLAHGTDPILIKPTKVGYQRLHEKFVAIGQFKSENSRTYYSKVEGTIDSILIEQGKNVAKGDVLVTIDNTIAKANIAKAEVAYESAKTTYIRDKALLNKKITSAELVDKSRIRLENAKSTLAETQKQYNNMIITATFDGYIGVIKARVGDDIKIGNYLFSLVADGEKTMFVALPESLYGIVDIESDVFVYDIGANKVQGKIVAVSDYLNDKGTIDAKLSFPASTKVMHGSYAETEIIFNKQDKLAIPEKGLLKNNKGNFVYKITDENKAVQVYVTTGVRTDNMIEISSDDIKSGDLVVLEGLTKVYEGVTVKLIDDDALKQYTQEIE